MNIGIAQWCLLGAGANLLQQARKLGCQSIHLDVGLPNSLEWLGSRDVTNKLLAASKQFEVRLAAIAVNVLCDYGITQPLSTSTGQVAWQATQTAIDAAQIMQIPLVTLPSFEQSQIITQKDFQFTRRYLAKACEYAAQRGIQIASENSLDVFKQQELLNAIDMPNLWLFFDTYNPLAFGHDPIALWQGLKHHIYPVVHIKDGHGGVMGNALIGTGEAPLRKLIKKIKYDTPDADLIIETDYPMMNEDAWKLLEKDISTIQALWMRD